MGDGPRFPPPRGEEPIGYREAGAPISDEKPELPVPSGPIEPHKRRVIASRPDDPDVALAKAFTPPRTRPQQASIGASVFIVLVVIGYFYLQIRHCH